MIEKLIENWLINVNEIGFQIPFCEVLLSLGYSVLYLSSHGPGEHGKDVIARDTNGKLWTFQLKGGDIRLSDWRAIRGEVEELVRLPVSYPGIEKDEPHIPVLVTNGDIKGDARDSIQQFAKKWEDDGAQKLQVWTKRELLKKFVDAHGNYLPSQLIELREFVKLYVADFEDRLPREAFSLFLSNLVATEVVGRKTTHIKRAIESAVLIGGYIVEQYERIQNHISAAEGWTIIAATIMHVVHRENLGEHHYSNSLQLVWTGLERNLLGLEKEVISRPHLLESRFLLAEPLCYNPRVTIVLGWLSAFSLIRSRFNKATDISHQILRDIFRREIRHVRITGEVDWPSFISLVLYIEASSTASEAELLLGTWIEKIIRVNKDESQQGLPSPYWLHEKILTQQIGDLPPSQQESFLGNSYTVMSAMDMLVRRLCRQQVSRFWPQVSRIRSSQLVPSSSPDWFLWHTGVGSLQHISHPLAISWGEWRQSVSIFDRNTVPKILLQHPEWILPFALTYPHRTNRVYSSLIDTVIGRRAYLK